MSAATSLYTLPFGDISSADHARVGGKCASLGEMTQAGVAVPPGFAVTTDAYQAMLDHHGLRAEIERHLASIGSDDIDGHVDLTDGSRRVERIVSQRLSLVGHEQPMPIRCEFEHVWLVADF